MGRVAHDIKRKDILHLAVLLHDLGKGQEEDHSLVGERLANEAALRLGYDEHETRLLVLLGLALTASGVMHLFVWLAAGLPSLAGPVSWRKPIVFGLSGGITTLSVAWIVSPFLMASRFLMPVNFVFEVT